MNSDYLVALRGAAGEGLEGGGFGGVEGGGGAADAAGAWDPSGIVAGVEGEEQLLSGGADLHPDNVGGVLRHRPAGGDGHDGAAGDEGGEELEPCLVAGLHLEHAVLP